MRGAHKRKHLPRFAVFEKPERLALLNSFVHPPVQRREEEWLARVAAEADARIDFSEIPPLTEKFWKNAVRNPFRRRAQQQLTVRLDADVVAWLQRQGEDYQSRLNGLLRKAMQDEICR